ncbi:MAG: response regulator [Elusimicrobia bacterium]|nr:response regulator [Elusimicrobiota bacterium]
MAKILIVDDEEGMRYVLTNILTKADYEVIAAEDGRKAMEMVKEYRPDMVFLDIHLPDMDGTEILKEIKKIKNIPVVMCSGFGDVDFAVMTMKYGAFDYVSKPFKNEDVLNMARKALVSVEQEKKEKKETVQGSSQPAVQHAVKKKGVKIPVFAVAGVLIAAVAVTGIFLMKGPGKGQELEKFSITYNNPTSIAYDGQYLWITDWFGQTIYKHNIDEEFSISQYYSFTDIHPAGIAWGNNSLWTVDSWTGEINNHALDGNLSVKKTYEYPGTSPSGIYYDGTFLWVCDVEEDQVYRFFPEENSLKEVDKYKSKGPNPVGVFWDGKNIWTVDGDLKRVYRHNLDTQLSVSETYRFPKEETADIKISGIGWDGANIWLAADKRSEILKISIKRLETIE